MSGHSDKPASCPLHPQKRTFVIALSMSALCQYPTFDRWTGYASQSFEVCDEDHRVKLAACIIEQGINRKIKQVTHSGYTCATGEWIA